MHPDSRPTVVIIGAGISGLTAAYRIQQARPETHITILEAAQEVGGKLQTKNVDGFTVESGPDVFLARKPWAVQLCRELGLPLQPTNPDQPGSFIRHNGRLHPLPDGFSGLVPTRWLPVLRSQLLSPAGKLRLLAEPLIRAGRGDTHEPLGRFVRRRLGAEAYQRIVQPLLGGIYGGDVDQLSLEATFPEMPAMVKEHGSLTRAMRKRAQTRSTQDPVSAFLTLRDGMGTLSQALAGRFAGHLRTGVRLEELRRAPGAGGGTDWQATPTGLKAHAVLCTTPAYQAANMLRAENPDLALVLDGIPYSSSRIVSMAFTREQVAHPLNGYGYLNPPTEHRAARACTWSSSKIKGRAPEGHVLLRVFFGRGPSDPLLSVSESAIVSEAMNEIRDNLSVRGEPLFHRVQDWPRSQPSYDMGHPDRLRRINRHLEAMPGLFLTGPAYRGVGIPDCIKQAEATASDIVHYLYGGSPSNDID